MFFVSCTTSEVVIDEQIKGKSTQEEYILVRDDELALEKRIAEIERDKKFKQSLTKNSIKAKPVTSNLKLPDEDKYTVFKSRSTSHLLYGVLPKPGPKLKSKDSHLHYSGYYYTKDDNRLLFVVAFPDNSQKPYLTDKIIYDDRKRPIARESYTRSGRHSYTRFVKYEGDKVIMTYRVYESNGEVKHLQYLNGFQPGK